MDIESYYKDNIDQVYQLNPTKAIEDLLKGEPVDTTYIIKLFIDINKMWEEYGKFRINFGIIIDSQRKGSMKNSIYDYKFENKITDIIKNHNPNRKLLILDIDFNIIEEVDKKQISHQIIAMDSLNTRSISFSLADDEVRVYICGHEVGLFKQFINTYYDVIEKKMYGIEYYKLLLRNFYESEVQYDPNRKIYAIKDNYHNDYRSKIEKNQNLLCAAPEEKIQDMLVKYLNANCRDIVQKEVRSPENDRYDIWVISQDSNIYVFELKWLGKSISANGNINSQYNNNERAVSGAFQLKDYVDNAFKYDELSMGSAIYCGVLVIYDARDEQSDLIYPKELNIKKYPNIDLTQHFKLVRNKIPASHQYEFAAITKDA